eukprot:5558318-Pyramimonas_sp.AAC.1
MCAALRRDPQFEKEPPSIRETLANVKKRMCAALRREPHFENDPPSMCEIAYNSRVIHGEEVSGETPGPT